LHASHPAHRKVASWLAAIVGAGALLLATPALSNAEVNPNQYTCPGLIKAGQAELGSEEQQVQYTFYCDGPVTGYQLQTQIPLTGVQSPPLVSDLQSGTTLNDSFACSGEIPGYAVNCVGAAKGGFERITGQFAIGTKLCAEPRVDPLLTVVFAAQEKTTVTQAISGPFDLGRPQGCRSDALSGSDRLNPKAPAKGHKKSKTHKKATKKK
jgi:hypothetical protein